MTAAVAQFLVTYPQARLGRNAPLYAIESGDEAIGVDIAIRNVLMALVLDVFVSFTLNLYTTHKVGVNLRRIAKELLLSDPRIPISGAILCTYIVVSSHSTIAVRGFAKLYCAGNYTKF